MGGVCPKHNVEPLFPIGKLAVVGHDDVRRWFYVFVLQTIINPKQTSK